MLRLAADTVIEPASLLPVDRAVICGGTVRNFVRRLGMIGAKEPDNAATQRTSHT